MSKSATICLRIDENLKRDSETVLRQLGMTTSEAIKIFLCAVRKCKGIPFPVQLNVAAPETVSSPRLTILSMRGQYRNLISSDEISRRKQTEIDKEEGRLHS